MKQTTHAIHEKLVFSAFLAASSGSIDAYTYLLHGGVFACLQTGNFIALGIRIGEGKLAEVPHFLLPLAAFVCGTVITRWGQSKLNEQPERRKKLLLGMEILILVLVGLGSSFLPNILFNSFLSIAAAIQLQEFQRMKGKPFTSLMMTGNLRNISVAFYEAFVEKKAAKREDFLDTFVILASFITGAALSGFFANSLADYTIYLSAALLIVPFYLVTKSFSTIF